MNPPGANPLEARHFDRGDGLSLGRRDASSSLLFVNPEPLASPASAAEFVGGMNVPSKVGGRLNATIPLVRLTIDANTVRMHPRFFASAMFSDFTVPLRAITAVFPLRSKFMTAGVGLELSDGQLAYFWSLGDRDRILSVLQQRGVAIDPQPRRALGAMSGQIRGLWSLGGSDSAPSVAELPGFSPNMRRLLPFLILFGTVVSVTIVSTGTPYGWLGAVLGLVGVAQAFYFWRRSRNT